MSKPLQTVLYHNKSHNNIQQPSINQATRPGIPNNVIVCIWTKGMERSPESLLISSFRSQTVHGFSNLVLAVPFMFHLWQVFSRCPLLPFGSLLRAGPHVHSLRRLHQIPLLPPFACKKPTSLMLLLQWCHHVIKDAWGRFRDNQWESKSQSTSIYPKIWMNFDGKGLAKSVGFPFTAPFCPGRGVLDAWRSAPKPRWICPKDPKSITQGKPEEIQAPSIILNPQCGST